MFYVFLHWSRCCSAFALHPHCAGRALFHLLDNGNGEAGGTKSSRGVTGMCPLLGLHPVMTVISRVCSTHDLSDLSVGCMNQCSKRRPPFSAGRSLKTSSLAAFFDAKGKRVPSNKWQCIRRLFKSHTTCNLPT